MKKNHLNTVFSGLFILCAFNLYGYGQSNLENQLQQERRQVYQGGETQEEEQYYQEVNPANIPSGTNFYQNSHPMQEAPLPATPMQEAPLPENQIPENPIPSNPI